MSKPKFVVAIFLAACAAVPPKPIRQEQSKPIYVEPMKFRMAKGTSLGGHYVFPFWRTEAYSFAETLFFNQEDLSDSSIQTLERSNYNSVHIVNRGNAAAAARFSLTGTVTSLSFNTYSWFFDDASVASVRVLWELRDPGGRLLYQTETGGWVEKEGVLDPLTVVTEAYVQSVEYLLSNQDFAVMAAAADDQRYGEYFSTGAPIPLAPCVPVGSPEEAAIFIRIGRSQAGGVFITNDGHALTSSHLLRGISRVPVVIPSTRQEVMADVVRVDKDDGVSLIRVPNRTSCVKLARMRPVQGSSVKMLAGTELDGEFSLSEATIVSMRPWLGFQLSELSVGLGSYLLGSVVLNDSGEIYAMVSQVPFYNRGKATAVPIEKIAARLRLEFAGTTTGAVQ